MNYSGIKWTIQAADKCKSLNSLIGLEAVGFSEGWSGKAPSLNDDITISMNEASLGQAAYHYGYAQGIIARNQ